MKEKIQLTPDLVVLSSQSFPRENRELANLLKVPRTAEGFFLEAHAKLRPVDFASDGIYVAGSAHAPKLISESISQAYAAVARACTILSKENLLVGGIVAVVDEERCAACLTCVRVCPYDVPVVNARGEAEIDIVKCKGCGTCAAECPARAIDLMHYRGEPARGEDRGAGGGMTAMGQENGRAAPGERRVSEGMADSTTPNGFEPEIIAFCCEH